MNENEADQIRQDFLKIDLPQIVGRVIDTKRGPRRLTRHSNQWSAEQEERLLVFYREGLKYGEIAQLVGKPRNAVCGKMKRLKDAGVIQ